MYEIAKQFGSYGPVWLLVGVLLMGFGAFIYTIIQGIRYGISMLFSTEPNPKTGEPTGLLVPFINQHLRVFERTEALTAGLKDAVESLASNTQMNQEHARNMERLMSFVEDRLKALDANNSRKVHRSLVFLSTVLIDTLETLGLDKARVMDYRVRLASIIDNEDGGKDK